MNILPPAHKVLQEKLIRESRYNFLTYIRYTKKDYQWGWFNEYLAYELEEFYRAYELGQNPHLMIHAPPRIGKSEQASRRFPAWIFGQNNKLDIVSCAFASDFAKRMSRDVQRIMASDEHIDVFPNAKISTSRAFRSVNAANTADFWEIVDSRGIPTNGSYRGAGVDKGITGQGFDIGIIEDPVKDYKNAASKTVQKNHEEWYDTTFYTRRNPKKFGVLVIMTRWHKKDLGGMLQERMSEGGTQWKELSFPMEAKKTEYITIKNVKYKSREKGEILFPERMDPDFVKSCKLNSLTWNALYQQSPTIAGGNFFKTDYFNFYSGAEPNVKIKRKIITGDTAQKAGEHNDFSVFQLWGLGEDNYIYLITQIRGKWESPELLRQAKSFWYQYGGGIVGGSVNAEAMYIEDKISGTGLIQQLISEYKIPCIPIPRPPNRDKGTRAIDALPKFHSGFIFIPENAYWVNEYLMEFEEFTLDNTHSHDDQIDPTLDAIEILLGNANLLTYSNFK